VRSRALQRGERKMEGSPEREMEIGPGNEPEELIGPSSSRVSDIWNVVRTGSGDKVFLKHI